MTNEEIRRHNRAIIEKYMAMVGQDRENRWQMFTDDATTGLQYTATGESLVISGIDNIRQVTTSTARISLTGALQTSRFSAPTTPTVFWLNAMAKEPPMFPADPSITRTTMFISSCFVTGKSACTASL